MPSKPIKEKFKNNMSGITFLSYSMQSIHGTFVDICFDLEYTLVNSAPKYKMIDE